MRRAILLVVLCGLAASPVSARTARDLSARIRIDGYTTEWADSEWVFGYNPSAQGLEEGTDDSKWGVNEDVNQIRVTWDARNLYLAVEGRIWDNNVILWIDSVPREGLDKMTDLNSWRRNFFFDTTGVSAGGGFVPDLFGATWDKNLSPHLVVNKRQGAGQVEDELSGTYFTASASFDQGNSGRSMEFAIPWSSVYLTQTGGPGVQDTTLIIEGQPVTVPKIPRGARVLIAAGVTTGADGFGGPDVAPDPSADLSNESGVPVNVDNWAIVSLDEVSNTGGGGGPDGLPDWDVTPKARIGFRYPPPIFGTRNCLKTDFPIDRPAFRPDLSERLHFQVQLDPVPDPADVLNELRRVNVTANVFDARGRFVRNLYIGQSRAVLAATNPSLDVWDGRDDRGDLVRPGVYMLRLVIEPNICRATRAVVVVR